ncbi:MAG: DNA-binding protein WhiA, partial [Clostridiales Family XIII bacterium]|nr:DNA-binding protein WhiA [Clostridiales Family XIII bacterium]
SLEFAFESHTVARAARKLLGSFEGIHAHIRQRRGSHVVYLSESEQIKDFLNIIGAHAQLLKFENVRVLKDVRNRTNRLNNCDSANYDKSTAAAARQLAVIERLRQDGRLEALPKDLAETARLREEHPEATLTELGSLHTPPISKATVSLRLKKLETLP